MPQPSKRDWRPKIKRKVKTDQYRARLLPKQTYRTVVIVLEISLEATAFTQNNCFHPKQLLCRFFLMQVLSVENLEGRIVEWNQPNCFLLHRPENILKQLGWTRRKGDSKYSSSSVIWNITTSLKICFIQKFCSYFQEHLTNTLNAFLPNLTDF